MKLLVEEDQSGQMRQVITTVEAIGVCRISWAETMAALARRQREDPISSDDLEQARQHLIQSWKTFTIVEVSQPLVETAGRFADIFALRGYDSVQLAAAHELHLNAEQTVLFACYDRRLNQAAQLLQLEVLP
jgi:predicted nucleic acid-binding protein